MSSECFDSDIFTSSILQQINYINNKDCFRKGNWISNEITVGNILDYITFERKLKLHQIT